MKKISNSKIRKLNDDGKLNHRYQNKIINAKNRNINFNLTFEEYCSLVAEAGLKSSQLGYTGENYVLARYNDKGPYEYGNCRFITQSENLKERILSEESIETCRKNMMIAVEQNKKLSEQDRSKRVLESEKWQKYINEKRIKHKNFILSNYQDTIEICFICGNPVKFSVEQHHQKDIHKNAHPTTVDKYFCCKSCSSKYGAALIRNFNFAIYYEKD